MSNAKKPGTGETNKRRKELAAAKAQRQQARRAARSAARQRRQRIGWGLVAMVAVLGISAIVFWPDDTGQQVASPADPLATPSAPASQAPVELPGCDPAPTPPANPQSWNTAPEITVDPDSSPELTLTTNCGPVVIETLPRKAPETVNAMLWLADQKYFDSTLCHRVTTEGIKVLQCGDPTATGTGGPGFELPDENLPTQKEGVTYPAGTVAMANAGPGTSGSQFFLVYEDTTLPPNYTIWGKVASGLDIVAEVAAAGVQGGGGDGRPAAPIGIVTARAQPQR